MFEAIARPFGWLLMILYDLFNNYALALIFIAIIVRVILLPFQMKGKRGQLKQTRLTPKIAELQKKHGANKQKLNEETAKLYKEEGVNPASGCLWSFIQMPIMIALFYAIRQPITLMMGLGKDLITQGVFEAEKLIEKGGVLWQKAYDLGNVATERLTHFYYEIDIAQDVFTNWRGYQDLGIEGLKRISFSLGNLDLSAVPNWQMFWSPETNWANWAWFPGFILFLLPLLSGGSQFLSAHVLRKLNPAGSPEASGGTAGKVMKFMPLISVYFGFIVPGALSLYWTIGTFLQMGQDIWLTKKYTKILDAEDEIKERDRKEKEAELEAKRLETERLKAEGLVEQNRNTSKRKKQKTEKQTQREKQAEWEKKHTPVKEKVEKDEPSRVGNRRYARGRAYDPDRYGIAGETDNIDRIAGEKTDSGFNRDDDSDIIDAVIIEDEDYDDDSTDYDDNNDEDDYDEYEEDEEDDADPYADNTIGDDDDIYGYDYDNDEES